MCITIYIYIYINIYSETNDLHKFNLEKREWQKVEYENEYTNETFTDIATALNLVEGNLYIFREPNEIWIFSIISNVLVKCRNTLLLPSMKGKVEICQFKDFLYLFGNFDKLAGKAYSIFKIPMKALKIQNPKEENIDLINYFNHSEFSDYRVIVNGKDFYVHKEILVIYIYIYNI